MRSSSYSIQLFALFLLAHLATARPPTLVRESGTDAISEVDPTWLAVVRALERNWAEQERLGDMLRQQVKVKPFVNDHTAPIF